MPTKNKRIPVPLSDDIHQLLERIARASGSSKAKVISGMMNEVRPMLEAMAEAYEMLHTDKSRAFENLDKVTFRAIERVMVERNRARTQGVDDGTHD